MDDSDAEFEDEIGEVCPVHGVNHATESEWTEQDDRDLEADLRRE
jgi:hypothetical protein